MTTAAILDRLALCNAEVHASITTAFRLNPQSPIQPAQLPCVYMRPDIMTQRVPRASSGSYIVLRRFVGTFLLTAAPLTRLHTTTDGAALLAAVEPWLDRFVDYYMTHPRLRTASLSDLAALSDDLVYQDNGPEMVTGADGREYAGFIFRLDIAERRISAALS